jgi:signal transduction histidine kinase
VTLGFSLASRSCFLLAAFALLALPQSAAAQSDARHAMLVLVVDQPGRVFAQRILEGIQQSTRDSIGLSTYVEFLGPSVLESPAVIADRERLVVSRYSRLNIEVLVAVGDQTLPLASRLRREFFPSAKLHFVAISKASVPPDLAQGEGIILDMNPIGTVNIVLKMMPEVTRLVVVGGTALPDETIREQFRSSLKSLVRQVEVTYLTGLPLPELQRELERIPPNSLFVLTSNFSDRSGRATTNPDQAEYISNFGALPVIEGSDLSLGIGALGGDLVAFRHIGAELGRRVLRTIETGNAAAGIEYSPAPRIRAFDWRQLRKLGIPESRAPKGFALHYRKPGFLEEHLGKLLLGLSILALQAILIFFLLAERRRRSQSQQRMARQLELEASISKASAELTAADYGQLPQHLQSVSADLARILRADLVLSWRFESPAVPPRPFHWWPPSPLPPPVANLPALAPHLRSGRELHLPSPSPALTDPAAEFHSLQILPLRAGDHLIGSLAFASSSSGFDRREECLPALRVFSDMIAQTMSRSLVEERERQAEERNRAMLASLPGFVAMLDTAGRILKLSDRLDLHLELLPPPLASAREGADFLSLWSAEPNAASLCAGIRSVIDLTEDRFRAEFRYDTPKGPRWLEARIEALSGSDRGAVVSFVDITDGKLAEAENTRNRETVYHLNRVASLGELTASLAHEINQPLAGILSSAEAAAELLDRPDPDLQEALAAVHDIIEDDKRAGSLIQGMRSMLRRKAEGVRAVDLSSAVSDTLQLIANEARLKQVVLRSELVAGLPLIAAVPAQLQQVVINLLSNAIDAVNSLPPPRRLLLIRTRLDDSSQSAFLEVRDSGPGIPARLLPTVFEPFVTTKEQGLGLGLPICRSIVESFGGRITADNSLEGGAVFRVYFRSFQESPATRTSR